MQLTSTKCVVMGITVVSCFLVSASAQDHKPSAVNPEVSNDQKRSSMTPKALQEMEEIIPIGTATIIQPGFTVTHAWFIDPSKGVIKVCSAVGYRDMHCEPAAVSPQLPSPGLPTTRYRAIGVSSIMAPSVNLSNAWFFDLVTMQIYACQALASLENVRCQHTNIR